MYRILHLGARTGESSDLDLIPHTSTKRDTGQSTPTTIHNQEPDFGLDEALLARGVAQDPLDDMDSDRVSCISDESPGGTTPSPTNSGNGSIDSREFDKKPKLPIQHNVQEIVPLRAAENPGEKSTPEQSAWITGAFIFSVLVDYVLIGIAILFLGKTGPSGRALSFGEANMMNYQVLGLVHWFLMTNPSAPLPGQYLK